jgi:hypothetical protein
VRLAKEADPEGIRTLGVLTKPDRIAAGEESQWKAVVEGSSFNLSLGWYVVCNPNQQQLEAGVSFAEARGMEKEFFAAAEVWRDPLVKSQLGVDNLRGDLSKHLVRLIQRALPKMLLELNDKLGEVRERLSELPAEIVSPRAEYSKLATLLKDDIQATLMASKEGAKRDYRNVQEAYEMFAKAVHLTQPVFMMDRDESVPGAVATSSASYKFFLVAGDGFTSDLTSATSEAEAVKMGTDPGSGRRTITIKEVAELICRERGREMPGCVPYSALVALIHNFQQDWAHLVEGCFSQVAAHVLAAALKHVDARFDRAPEMRAVVR